MSRIEKTVFICYRRTNAAWALLIYKALRSEGYDVFIDYTGIASGAFETVITENIQSRAHFLVLLTPSSLENASMSSKDWMRFETQVALDCKRNVVPVTLEGFKFDEPSLTDKITGEFAQLKHYNALSVPDDISYFDFAMSRLRDDFLNVELDAVSHPPSPELTEIVTSSQTAADNAPDVTPEELTAQKWFERGFAANNPKDKIQYYSEAIRLDPEDAFAHFNRGHAHAELGDQAASIKDYDEAIRLSPEDADAYINRGALHYGLGDQAAAIKDYDEAIQLNPEDADAYFNRGTSHSKLGDRAAAIKDYDEAIRLNPEHAKAHFNRGLSHAKLGDRTAAIKDYDEAIQLNPEYAKAYINRGNSHAALGDRAAAIKDYDEAIRLNPEYTKAYNNRGQLHKLLGNLKASESDFKKADDLN
jgi:tetratricopeptide (TPR) repeat protein